MRTEASIPRGNGSTGRRLGYRPILDGLRAVAIILVLAHHTPYGEAFPGGFIGLDVFLALSGFLITSLLLEEKETSGRISLRSFYIRRALRILPAFSVLLLVYIGGALLRADEPLRSTMLDGAAKTATYQSNIVLAGGDEIADELVHTWSLVFEEQFYLVWPITLIGLLALSRTRRGVMVATAIAIAGVTGLRLYLWARGASWERIYFAPDTRADSLLVGCLAAQLYYWTPFAERFRNVLRPALVAVLLALVPFSFLVHSEWRAMPAAPMTVIAVAMAVLVLGCLTAAPRPLLSLLENRGMVIVGRLSYSMYLWHVPIFMYMQRYYPGRLPLPELPLVVRTGAAVALTFAAAAGSYYIVELPFLRLKRRFARVKKPPVEEMALAVAPDAARRSAAPSGIDVEQMRPAPVGPGLEIADEPTTLGHAADPGRA